MSVNNWISDELILRALSTKNNEKNSQKKVLLVNQKHEYNSYYARIRNLFTHIQVNIYKT